MVITQQEEGGEGEEWVVGGVEDGDGGGIHFVPFHRKGQLRLCINFIIIINSVKRQEESVSNRRLFLF